MGEALQVASIPTASSPLTYTVAELGTVDWQSAFAHYDGTGASGGFLAAMTVRSQNGAIVARVWPSTQLAAGDTGDVTFVPFGVGETASAGLTWDQGIILLGATSTLLGWWKLNESGAPFADSNPYLPHLDMSDAGSGAAITTGITGPLAGAQNINAIQTNGLGVPSNPSYVNGHYLNTTATNTRWNLGSQSMSVAAWIKPAVIASAVEGGICGNLSAGGGSFAGWGLVFDWPSGDVFFERWASGGPSTNVTATVSLGAWHFIVATYSTVSGSKIYADGALAASDATLLSIADPSAPMQIGSTIWAPSPSRSFYEGGVAEVTVWGSALSAGDVANLYSYGISQ